MEKTEDRRHRSGSPPGSEPRDGGVLCRVYGEPLPAEPALSEPAQNGRGEDEVAGGQDSDDRKALRSAAGHGEDQ